MKYYILLCLLLSAFFISGCVQEEAPPTEEATQYPPIESGKGRVILELEDVPEEITTRKIVDDFLIGVGTTGPPRDCTSPDVLKDLRSKGINYFLPFMTWSVIETSEGSYTGDPCTGEEFISWAEKSGAVMNGHCFVWLYTGDIDDKYNSIPQFAFGRSFDEQKEMMENFVKATVNRFPEIKIWSLNEPIAQTCFGWSREQNYDVFVSASRWIHEVNPEAKVMVNMIPIPVNWAGLDYDPNEVLDDLLDRGLEADIIGIELHYGSAEAENLDENGYPTLDWVADRLDVFRGYGLPIIFSEVSIPYLVDGREQLDRQADWMEAFFRFCHNQEDVIGAVWYYIRDQGVPSEPGMYSGLADNDYTYRPVGERLIELANEWNPSTTHNLNGQKYLDLDPGEYDVIVNQEVFRVSVAGGQIVMITEGS